MDSARENMDIARKVADQLKRNGEFDRCRREVLSKVVESNHMKRSQEDCRRLVKQCIKNASANTSIAKLRESVKEQIRRKGMITPLMNCADMEFRKYESSSKLHETIEEICRAELNLPPCDSNIELVDMEVSSGASSTSSRSSASSSMPSVADNQTNMLIKKSNSPSTQEKKLESTRSASPVHWPKAPSLIHSLNYSTGDNSLNTGNKVRNKEIFGGLSPTNHSYVSRTPSVISDDSLPTNNAPEMSVNSVAKMIDPVSPASSLDEGKNEGLDMVSLSSGDSEKVNDTNSMTMLSNDASDPMNCQKS